MTSKLDMLINLAKWVFSIPLIILCVDEFRKAVISLRGDGKVKGKPNEKINFLLGVVFLIVYIPNLYVREANSYIFLIAAWLCLFSVSNRMPKSLEKSIGLSNETNNNWKF